MRIFVPDSSVPGMNMRDVFPGQPGTQPHTTTHTFSIASQSHPVIRPINTHLLTYLSPSLNTSSHNPPFPNHLSNHALSTPSLPLHTAFASLEGPCMNVFRALDKLKEAHLLSAEIEKQTQKLIVLQQQQQQLQQMALEEVI